MFLSLFEIFKVGIGPSSSHTMGPMVAAGRFLEVLRSGVGAPGAGQPVRVAVSLHGSLAWTGKGHHTDRAVVLGLDGPQPADLDPAAVEGIVGRVALEKCVRPDGIAPLAFDPEADLVFDFDTALEGHANGLAFSAFDEAGRLRNREVYYSVGGGFVVTEGELAEAQAREVAPMGEDSPGETVPYPFASAEELLAMADGQGVSIADLVMANERHAAGGDPEAVSYTHLRAHET